MMAVTTKLSTAVASLASQEQDQRDRQDSPSAKGRDPGSDKRSQIEQLSDAATEQAVLVESRIHLEGCGDYSPSDILDLLNHHGRSIGPSFQSTGTV